MLVRNARRVVNVKNVANHPVGALLRVPALKGRAVVRCQSFPFIPKIVQMAIFRNAPPVASQDALHVCLQPRLLVRTNSVTRVTVADILF